MDIKPFGLLVKPPGAKSRPSITLSSLALKLRAKSRGALSSRAQRVLLAACIRSQRGKEEGGVSQNFQRQRGSALSSPDPSAFHLRPT